MTRRYRRTRRAFPSVQAWMDFTGTTQEELAEIAGISQSHLCNVLRGNRSCSASVALRLSKITNVPVETIIEASPVVRAAELAESAK